METKEIIALQKKVASLKKQHEKWKRRGKRQRIQSPAESKARFAANKISSQLLSTELQLKKLIG